MMHKATLAILALLVFCAATFAVAPMAFCTMKVEKPSCCKKPVSAPQHCETPKSNCPICASNLCKLDPAPTHSGSSTPVTTVQLQSDVPVSFTVFTGYLQPAVYLSSPNVFDSSPPLFVQTNCFRL